MEIKVVIITIDEPLYIPSMIKNLIVNSPPEIKFLSITLLPSIPPKFSRFSYIIYQMKFLGGSQFMKVVGKYCVKKILNWILSSQYSVEKIARDNQIQVIKTKNLISKKYLNFLRNLDPDIILSIASTRIFNEEILNLPKRGCINVHAGMLPHYRGINPSFWVLLNQESKSAVTVHYMTKGIDEGNIIKQTIFDIKGIKSLHEVYMKVLKIAPLTVIESLIDLMNDKVKIKPNESKDSTYYSFPTIEDGKKFRDLGFRFM